MGNFNQPDEPLERHFSAKVAPIQWKRYDEKRRELGVTWSRFVIDAVEEKYFED